MNEIYEIDKLKNKDHVATPRWVVENIYDIINIKQLKIYDEYLENGEVILMRKTNEELHDRGNNRTIN